MSKKIAIIGLGYVGLPLAVEFGKLENTMGFDINSIRVEELRNGIEKTLEVNPEHLKSAKYLKFTSNLDDLKNYGVYIITVPTPIDKFKKPDLRPLISASNSVGKVLSKGNIVVYESTVYPGCTEEECIPILEKISGLKFNKDFFVGFSPERINPGDKVHTLKTIKKVTSGSTPECAEIVDQMYNKVVDAGTHKASSIKVAEASKVIENSQRDLNIAFVNELALIFDKLGIDTIEVLEAAGTKWNFLPFRPGLVGGHCIGVDPYYLTHKAQSIGYHPEVILAGRRINDNMGNYVANKVVKLMIQNELLIKGGKVLLLGFTFKENCPDIRNTRVIDVYNEFIDYGCIVDVYEPWASSEEIKKAYNIDTISDEKELIKYDSIVVCVSHKEFSELNLKSLKKSANSVIYDVKAYFNKDSVSARL